jgi:hypothetical protein
LLTLNQTITETTTVHKEACRRGTLSGKRGNQEVDETSGGLETSEYKEGSSSLGWA